MKPISPKDLLAGVPSFRILINSGAIKESIAVNSIEITRTKNELDRAEISLIFQSTEFAMGNEPLNDLKLNDAIEIELGYDTKNESQFIGIITQKEISVQTNGDIIAQISCTSDPKNKSTENKDPKTVLKVIYGSDILEAEFGFDIEQEHLINGNVNFHGTNQIRIDDSILIERLEYILPIKNSTQAAIKGFKHVISEGEWTTCANIQIDLNQL